MRLRARVLGHPVRWKKLVFERRGDFAPVFAISAVLEHVRLEPVQAGGNAVHDPHGAADLVVGMRHPRDQVVADVLQLYRTPNQYSRNLSRSGGFSWMSLPAWRFAERCSMRLM